MCSSVRSASPNKRLDRSGGRRGGRQCGLGLRRVPCCLKEPKSYMWKTARFSASCVRKHASGAVVVQVPRTTAIYHHPLVINLSSQKKNRLLDVSLKPEHRVFFTKKKPASSSMGVPSNGTLIKRSCSSLLTEGGGSFSPGDKDDPSWSSSSSSSSSSVGTAVQYWQRVVETSVHKPTAMHLLRFIDTSNILGCFLGGDSIQKKDSLLLRQGGAKKPPLYNYFLQVKKKYPRALVLVRIGDFYESVGLDAVLLVQHAGLNPMGRPTPQNPFVRAGFPKGNLRRTVEDLVHGAGLSVVICEEVPTTYSYGRTRTKQKERYIAALVTPANPHLTHGLLRQEGADIPLEAAPPLLGIVPRVGGHSLIEVHCELRKVVVTEGLTDDAIFARLYEGGLSPPLYLYSHAWNTGGHPRQEGDSRTSEATPEREWEARVSDLFKSQVGSVELYGGPDPIQGMLHLVQRDSLIQGGGGGGGSVFSSSTTSAPSSSRGTADSDSSFLGVKGEETTLRNQDFVVTKRRATERPRPVYFSTATNLGLHKTRGVPSLLDAVLPAGVPIPARKWLKDVLLRPPPPSIRQAVYRMCWYLAHARETVPAFPVISPVNIVLKIRSRQANDSFFRDVGTLCCVMQDICSMSSQGTEEEEGGGSFAEALLEVASAEVGLGTLTVETLRQACAEAQSLIWQTIHWQTRESVGDIHPTQDEDALRVHKTKDMEQRTWDSPPTDTNDQYELYEVIDSYVRSNEGSFRGKIRDSKLARELEQVDAASGALRALLSAALDTALEEHHAAGGTLKTRPRLVFDTVNNAVWLKVANQHGGSSSTRVTSTTWSTPMDRNGRRVDSRCIVSTQEIEEALHEYRRACAEASERTHTVLMELARELEHGFQLPLVVAGMASVVATALDAHVREALFKGWSLDYAWAQNKGPEEGPHPNTEIPKSAREPFPTEHSYRGEGGENVLTVENMWPYWMDVRDARLTKNSIKDMNGMYILTGPNMAGKSTILRTLAATCLLASCGLFMPAEKAALPGCIDAFMLRTFSSDSPLEGRSAFAVEMNEMRHVFDDVTPHSLVLIDELGKGTDVQAGAALAGAMLERLDAAGCKGIFATHLHLMLDMPLVLSERVKRMMMETTLKYPEIRGPRKDECSDVDVVVVPTWKLVEGTSTASLALDVARDCRLPDALVRRAATLYRSIRSSRSSSRRSENEESSFLKSEHNKSTLTLEDVADVLQTSADSTLQALLSQRERRKRSKRTDRGSSLVDYKLSLKEKEPEYYYEMHWGLAGSQQQEDMLNRIRRGVVFQQPAPRLKGCACVYVVQRSDGFFYCGSTTDIHTRLEAHRTGSRTVVGGDPGARVVFLQLRHDMSMAAQAIESEVIKALVRCGAPMLSVADGRRRTGPWLGP